jgi:hypothetical protein
VEQEMESDLAMSQWTLYNGASCGPDRCALIVQPMAEYYDGPLSAIVCWDEATGFDITVVPVRLDSIVALDDRAAGVVCMARWGTIVTLVDGQLQEDEVDPTDDGPQSSGGLTALRAIGNDLYVAGMGRQVYRRRMAGGLWERADNGVLDTSLDPQGEITGFWTIDGSGDEVWAAGFGGELWLRHPSTGWRRIPNLTDKLIYSMRVGPSGELAACGQCGLLMRGREQVWQVIAQDFHGRDLMQIEFFAGAVFVATQKGTFRIDSWPRPDHASLVPEGDGPYFVLSVGRGALWAFAPERAAVTIDGYRWRSLDLAPLWSQLQAAVDSWVSTLCQD